MFLLFHKLIYKHHENIVIIIKDSYNYIPNHNLFNFEQTLWEWQTHKKLDEWNIKINLLNKFNYKN